MRLGRVLVGLSPNEAEVHGLVALMEIQASRTRARTGPNGEPILLPDQNRALWNQLLIRRGLAALIPAEAEVHGLVALMEIQASRSNARVGANGEPILLLDQNRGRWDQLLIGRGLTALARAESLTQVRGSYTLQAAIAACHARAREAAETDWHRIAELYRELSELTRSPIVELNRAVAVSMAFGPALGLDLLDSLREEPSLRNYHLLPAVRADLLIKLGRPTEARTELERAASLTRNERERALLLERAEGLRA